MPRFSSEDMDAVEIYYQAEIDRVTKVACEVIKILRRNALFDDLSAEAKAWSHEHDAWDAARDVIQRSVRPTIRRDTFDDRGNQIDYGDGRYAISENAIDALRTREFGEDYAVDQELSRQVFEDLATDFPGEALDEQQEGDDTLDAAIQGDYPVLD
jgi:hypothetical protein